MSVITCKTITPTVDLAAEATGTTIEPIMIQGADDLETAFRAMEKDRPDAVIVKPSLGLKPPPELAMKYRIPAISIFREFVQEGGLMSCTVVEADVHHRTAAFTDQILKGAKPANPPVEQRARFELVIYLQTAKKLGLCPSRSSPAPTR